MQSMTAPRGRLITANTPVVILDEYNAPIQMLQNDTAGNANVTLNGGVSFHIKGNTTLLLNIPIYGTIESDVNLIALA